MKSRSKPVSASRPRGNHISAGSDLLFQNNPLPMWVYELDTLCFLDVNEAAVEQYGYARGEFLNMRVTDLLLDKKAPLPEARKKNKRPPLKLSGEMQHRRKDGSAI
ncbi:MAG: PAS domain-containing protein, partial [Chloroflexi bacterium]|nr:PAS domain-containing protein [Chloroflexota bacterium]